MIECGTHGTFLANCTPLCETDGERQRTMPSPGAREDPMLTDDDADPRERWGLCSPRERAILTALADIPRATVSLYSNHPRLETAMQAELDRRENEPDYFTTVWCFEGGAQTSIELKVEPYAEGRWRALMGGKWLDVNPQQVHRR